MVIDDWLKFSNGVKEKDHRPGEGLVRLGRFVMDWQDHEGKLKKSYKLLVAWFGGYLILMTGLSVVVRGFESWGSEKLTSLLFLLMTHVFLLSLFWMVYVTQRVYYINGVSYKAAARASEEARKAYALRHIEAFRGAALLFLVYCGVSWGLRLPALVDGLVYCGLLIVAAVRTVPYKLE